MDILKNLGEFGLIKEIKKQAVSYPSVIKGIGDDCAVIKYNKDKYLLFTTDMIIEDSHFKRDKIKPEDIGHKALAVNISDILACGGIPKWCVVSVGLPNDITIKYSKDIFKGMNKLARKFNISIAGGDTNLSEKIVISAALIGEVKKKRLLLRSGAKDKDVIVLSGNIEECPNHLRFVPEVEKIQCMLDKIKVNSMIDISDGLFSDLKHILNESKKTALIYESLIPIKSKTKTVYDALNIGEQFKFLMTISRSEMKKLPAEFYPIGEIMKGRGEIIYIDKKGGKREAKPDGYAHF